MFKWGVSFIVCPYIYVGFIYIYIRKLAEICAIVCSWFVTKNKSRERKENQEHSEHFLVEDFKGNRKNPNKAHSHKGFFSTKSASTTSKSFQCIFFPKMFLVALSSISSAGILHTVLLSAFSITEDYWKPPHFGPCIPKEIFLSKAAR